MKKKVLATLMSVVILMSVFAFCFGASAVSAFGIGDIKSSIQICPGTVLPLEAPEITGDTPFTQGWEIKYSEDSSWIPYDGSALPEYSYLYEGTGYVWVRYFACDESGEIREFSNECEVYLAHIPTGTYQHNALEHWRVCSECGGKCEIDSHTSLTDSASGETCMVCGAQRSYHFSFIAKLWDWLMGIIMSFIG